MYLTYFRDENDSPWFVTGETRQECMRKIPLHKALLTMGGEFESRTDALVFAFALIHDTGFEVADRLFTHTLCEEEIALFEEEFNYETRA